MDIEISKKGRALVVKIDGEIDHHSAERVKDRIDSDFRRTNAKHILLNFERVRFMDSAGIGMIIGRYKLAQKEGGELAMVNISPETERIFELSGLHKIIKTFQNVDTALNAL